MKAELDSVKFLLLHYCSQTLQKSCTHTWRRFPPLAPWFEHYISEKKETKNVHVEQKCIMQWSPFWTTQFLLFPTFPNGAVSIVTRLQAGEV
jgi:hypothetical protein